MHNILSTDGKLDYRNRGKTGWHAVTKREPCPICQRHDNCKVADDGTKVWCGRQPHGAIKGPNAGGQFLHILGDGRPRPEYVHPSHRKRATKGPEHWGPLAAQLHRDGSAQLHELADLLGVDESALVALRVGRGVLDATDCWTFPERDATGQVIGINRRLVVAYADGKNKIQASGGSRGLTFTDNWYATPGDIHLVEGGSDTAALMTMGLAVIGRPSNCGGVDLLAELLRDHADRRIIVVGENDQKPDGRWHGRDGARRTAEGLAEKLGRPVCWSLVNASHKDARAFLQARGRGAAGDLLQPLTVCEPPKRVEVVPLVDDDRPVVTLKQWRDQMAEQRAEIVGTSGVFIDRSPTGAGKSYADAEVIRTVDSSLTLLPTHVLADEFKRDLIDRGVAESDVGKYPDLNRDSCQKFQDADKARRAGLAVRASVCHSCQFNTSCRYLSDLEAAERAPHKVACHARGSSSLSTLAKGATFVSIHEDCRDLLKPMSKCVADELQAVEKLARNAKFERHTPDADEWQFFDALERVAAWLVEQLKNATETSTMDCLPWCNHELTKQWQRTAWKAIESNFLDAGRLGEALPLCAAILAGDLHELTVVVHMSHKKGHGQEKQREVWLQGSWATKLPSKATVLVGDATADAKVIERLTGTTPIDVTPCGRLDNVHELTQFVRHDVTKGMTAESAAVELRSVLAKYPWAKRVGVIGHREHVSEWLDDSSPVLDERTRGRIAMWSYFGKGDDRGSNEWHKRCDLLVIVGTPRVGADAVRSELVRQGQHDAAKQLEPDWLPYSYEAHNAAGELVVVESKRYATPAWQSAYETLTVAALKQAVGRARSAVNNDGKPAVVLSHERLVGVAVEIEELPRLTPEVLKLVGIVERLGINASTQRVADLAELTERHVLRLLTVAEGAGMVERYGGVWYSTDEQTDIFANRTTLGEMSVSMTPPPGFDDERQAIVAEGSGLSPRATVADLAAEGLVSWPTSAVTLASTPPPLAVSCGPPPETWSGTIMCATVELDGDGWEGFVEPRPAPIVLVGSP